MIKLLISPYPNNQVGEQWMSRSRSHLITHGPIISRLLLFLREKKLYHSNVTLPYETRCLTANYNSVVSANHSDLSKSLEG